MYLGPAVIAGVYARKNLNCFFFPLALYSNPLITRAMLTSNRYNREKQ